MFRRIFRRNVAIGLTEPRRLELRRSFESASNGGTIYCDNEQELQFLEQLSAQEQLLECVAMVREACGEVERLRRELDIERSERARSVESLRRYVSEVATTIEAEVDALKKPSKAAKGVRR